MADVEKVNLDEVMGREVNPRESPSIMPPPSKVPSLTSIFTPWILTGNEWNSPFYSLPCQGEQVFTSAERFETSILPP